MHHNLSVMGLYSIRDAVAVKACNRRKNWPFDHCDDSPDMRDAMARAVRVWFRVVRATRVSKAMARGF